MSTYFSSYPMSPEEREIITKVCSINTAVRHKDAERDLIAGQISEFEANGGKIERLGNTPTSSPVKSSKIQQMDDTRAKLIAAKKAQARQHHRKSGYGL